MQFIFLFVFSSSSFSFFRNPLYHSDFIYNLTPTGRKFNANSEIVAQKADEIIKKRRQALIDQVSVSHKKLMINATLLFSFPETSIA